jgi:hypothetical protein
MLGLWHTFECIPSVLQYESCFVPVNDGGARGGPPEEWNSLPSERIFLADYVADTEPDFQIADAEDTLGCRFDFDAWDFPGHPMEPCLPDDNFPPEPLPLTNFMTYRGEDCRAERIEFTPQQIKRALLMRELQRDDPDAILYTVQNVPVEEITSPAYDEIAAGLPLVIEWTTDVRTDAATVPTTLITSVDIEIREAGTGTILHTASGEAHDGEYSEWTPPVGLVGTPLVLELRFNTIIDYPEPGVALKSLTVRELFADASDASGISIPFGSQPYAALAADLDGDDDEDLVISYEDRRAQYYVNSGPIDDAATFDDDPTNLGDANVRDTRGLNAIDVDSDGALDLFFASATGSELWLGQLSGGEPTGEITGNGNSALTSISGLASTGSAWADYDFDGDLDAYVLLDAPQSDRLLESNGDLTAFTDVSTVALLASDVTTTTSASWADVDSDGDMDLFVGWGAAVGAAGLGHSALYLNQGESAGQTTFQEVGNAPSGGPGLDAVGHVSSVEWVDVSGDGLLDLILGRAAGSGTTEGNLILRLNSGSADFHTSGTSFGLYVDEDVDGVRTLDVDGNGVPDILSVGATSTDVNVALGSDDAAQRTFTDVSAASGISAGSALGLLTADLNDDADHDVLLLRPESSVQNPDREYLWSNRASEAPSGANMTVQLDLGDRFTFNRQGIGATVRVDALQSDGSTLTTTRVFDGGSGRAAQGSNRLPFGIGDATDVTLRVDWPDGTSQVIDADDHPDYPRIELQNTTNPQTVPETISRSAQISSSAVVHEFTWDTSFPGGEPQVRVDLRQGSNPACSTSLPPSGSITLRSGVAGVSVSTLKTPTGWRRTVEWTTACHAVCYYDYSVRVVKNGFTYASAEKTMNVSVCGQIFQQ